jgi:hypothetical protein
MSQDVEVIQVLSEQQQSDYGYAESMAWAANLAFDNRINAARNLASHVHEDGFIVPSDLVAELQTDLAKSDEQYRLHRIGAEALMPSRLAFETNEPIEPFASETVWGAMSREQKVKAAELRTSIAAGPLKEQGVTEDSLRVVSTEVDGQKKFTLIHTGVGVDIGNHRKDYDKARSYSSVMSDENDALFQVEVNGVTYDTRSGMTDEVYATKVEDARSRNVTLPDSAQLRDETGDLWTWTMLTGEPLTADGLVQFRSVGEGEVNRFITSPDHDFRALRVCPAVEIK